MTTRTSIGLGLRGLRGLRGLGVLTVGVLASGCLESSTDDALTSSVADLDRSASSAALPHPTRTLRRLGAIGDGRADDTAALQAAAARAGECLDGENREFRVVGNILVTNDFCLLNATLIQDIDPVDTSGYIRSLARGEPVLRAAPFEVRAYDEDPTLSIDEHKTLMKTIALKTIYVRGKAPTPLRVVIRNVKINKGKSEFLGVGTEGAGIWLQGVTSGDLDNVEIFGKGRGFGVAVYESSGVRINKLHVHDITWSQYRGDRPFVEARIRDTFSWNNGPIYRYIPEQRKFAHVRTQEEVSGLGVILSQNVEVTNTVVERLFARFDTGLIPWQADGMTVGHAKNITMKKIQVGQTWEGIDFTGDSDGVDTFSMDGIRINDIHSFGLKFVYATKKGTIRDAVVRNAGLAGLVFSNGVSDIKVADTHVRETGMVHTQRGVENLWKLDGTTEIAGFRMMGDANRDIRIVESTAYNYEFPGAQKYGFLSDSPASTISGGNISATGASIKDIHGFGRGGKYTYEQAAAEYRRINGCTGDPMKMIWFWDQSSHPVNGAPWTLARLSVDLVDLKQRGILYCSSNL